MTPTSVHFGRKLNRPKRPPTAYITFMKKFLRAQCIKSKKGAQTAVKAGAKRWNKMSDAEKAKFGKHCAKGRMSYKLEKAEYLRQLKAMKAPPRPYGAFVANYFKECGLSSKSKKFVEMNRQALNLWHNLPPSEKDKYRNDFYQQYDDFCRRVEGRGSNNSGDFVAAEKTSISADSEVDYATAAIGSFDLRKIRREKRRLLLQQKLEREQRHQSRITSRTNARDTIQGTGPLILEQDGGSSKNKNKDAETSIVGAAALTERQDGSCTSSSSEGRILRGRKVVEVKDERISTFRVGGNEKNLKLISKNDRRFPMGASANAVGKNKFSKNHGEVKKTRGRPTLATIALRNKQK